MRAVLIAGGLALSVSAASASVTTYHNGNTRHGLYVVPGLTASSAAAVAPDTGFKAVLNGNIYAQPLFWQKPGGGSELIVATENNIVYALNPIDGRVIWEKRLAKPITGGLPCGNINPDGITGTPAIDPASGTLFLNAETDIAGAPQHELYALSLEDGTVQSGWPLSVQLLLKGAGVTFTPAQQGSRSGLLFANGALYASYGGRAGDCTPYHGTIVQVDPAARALKGNWETRAVGGGIWSQGGVSSDGQYIFATTGNTFNANNNWGDGEAILRLLPGLAHATSPAGYYAPANWQSLDNTDTDLGGTEALPLGVATASGKAQRPRLIALGKDGNAYLVNRLSLGGIGGPASITKVSNSEIITGPAVYESGTETLLAFESASGLTCGGRNITMLTLQTASKTPITTKWCVSVNAQGAPIITTTDGVANPLVWVVGAEGDNLLHGYNAITGQAVYTSTTPMQGLHHFQTLIAAEGRFYIAADNTVYAFTLP